MKRTPVYRFESWLERQVYRDDEVGTYARAASGQGVAGRVGAYLEMTDAAHKAHDEFAEYLKLLPVKGSSREYALSEVVGMGQASPGTSPAVIADADEPMSCRSVLCLLPGVRGEHLAVFESYELADVYLYRLRKKGLLDHAFRVISIPASLVDRAVFFERTHALPGVAFCRCRGLTGFHKAYNLIDFSTDNLRDHVDALLWQADTAFRHELHPYHDDSVSYHKDSRQVEWSVASLTKTEAEARAQLAEKRQQMIDERVEAFYATAGNWVDIETVGDAARVFELIDKDRELYEACYLVDQEGHKGAAHYRRVRDGTSTGYYRRARDIVRVLDVFDAAPGSSVNSPEELFSFFKENDIDRVVVTERPNVRYLRGEINPVWPTSSKMLRTL